MVFRLRIFPVIAARAEFIFLIDLAATAAAAKDRTLVAGFRSFNTFRASLTQRRDWRSAGAEQDLLCHQGDDQASFDGDCSIAGKTHCDSPKTNSAGYPLQVSRDSIVHFTKPVENTILDENGEMGRLSKRIMYTPQRYWFAFMLVFCLSAAYGCRTTSISRNQVSYQPTRSWENTGPVESPSLKVKLASHSPIQPSDVVVVDASLPLKLGTSDSDAAAETTSEQEGDSLEQRRLVERSIVAQSQSQKLPVEGYVSIALSRNPRISALKHRIASLSNRIPKARALPDPTLQETFWPFNGNALETAGGRAANQVGIAQQVPWPEKLKAKAAIACREVQVADAALRQEKLDITESVGLACIEIWFADQAIAVVDEFGELVKQLNEVSEAKYRSAAKGSGQQDVLRAQLEGDRLEDRRIQLLRQKQLAQADLAALLHDPQMPNPEVENPIQQGSLSTQLGDLIGLASSCNPSLAGIEAEIARDRAKQKLACLQQYPDFQLGANWLIVSDNNALSPVATGNDNFAFTFGMTLPVWRDKIRAGVAEAGHQTLSSANRLESRKDSIAGSLRRLVTRFDASTEQLRILEERIIPRTEDALEISLADYTGNRTDFLAVVDLYEERLMLELQRIALSRSQYGILIQIEALVGSKP